MNDLVLVQRGAGRANPAGREIQRLESLVSRHKPRDLIGFLSRET